MSSRLESDKNIASASEALVANLQEWMKTCNLHPDEIAQELSYFFSGLWNRTEDLTGTVKKIKGKKPTKK
jgi:hypothetical protein